jgi:hypothetical protein
MTRSRRAAWGRGGNRKNIQEQGDEAAAKGLGGAVRVDELITDILYTIELNGYG